MVLSNAIRKNSDAWSPWAQTLCWHSEHLALADRRRPIPCAWVCSRGRAPRGAPARKGASEPRESDVHHASRLHCRALRGSLIAGVVCLDVRNQAAVDNHADGPDVIRGPASIAVHVLPDRQLMRRLAAMRRRGPDLGPAARDVELVCEERPAASRVQQQALAVHLLPDGRVVLQVALDLRVLALECRPRRGRHPELVRGPRRTPRGLRDAQGSALRVLLHPLLGQLAVGRHKRRALRVNSPTPRVVAVHPPGALMWELGQVPVHSPQLAQVALDLVAVVGYHPEASRAAEQDPIAGELAPDGLAVCDDAKHASVLALQCRPPRGHDPEPSG
mmetsp:Transcript_86967/g.246577  ORF Transcript_86967/g.246577 Transcript_86967/m.246577 type:complete len:332 (+) Transcript_86967:344-1339(+)